MKLRITLERTRRGNWIAWDIAGNFICIKPSVLAIETTLHNLGYDVAILDKEGVAA